MNLYQKRSGAVYPGKIDAEKGLVYACGRWMRLRLEGQAKAAGMDWITEHINLITEAEVLAGVAEGMERAGCEWCLVPHDLTTAGEVATARVWRTGMETTLQSEKRRQAWALKRVRENMGDMGFLSSCEHRSKTRNEG